MFYLLIPPQTESHVIGIKCVVADKGMTLAEKSSTSHNKTHRRCTGKSFKK